MRRKAYKGIAMEGLVARWYSRIQQKSVEQYVSWAKMARDKMEAGSSVLGVARWLVPKLANVYFWVGVSYS